MSPDNQSFKREYLWQGVHSLPSTAFQKSMLDVIYLVSALAFFFYCIRMHSKIVQKQLGLGERHPKMKSQLPANLVQRIG